MKLEICKNCNYYIDEYKKLKFVLLTNHEQIILLIKENNRLSEKVKRLIELLKVEKPHEDKKEHVSSALGTSISKDKTFVEDCSSSVAQQSKSKRCMCGYFVSGMPEYNFCPLCSKKLKRVD